MDHTSKKAIEIGIIKLKGQLEEKMMWARLNRVRGNDDAADKALAEAGELLALIKKKENKLNPTPSIDEPPSTDELLKMFEGGVGRPPKLGSIGEEVSQPPEPHSAHSVERRSPSTRFTTQGRPGPQPALLDIETLQGDTLQEDFDRRLRLLRDSRSGTSELPELNLNPHMLTKNDLFESLKNILPYSKTLIEDPESSLEDFEGLIDGIGKLLLTSNKGDDPEIEELSSILNGLLNNLEIEKTKRQIKRLNENYLELIEEMGASDFDITILTEKFISLMENIMVQQGYMREDEIFVELKPHLDDLYEKVNLGFQQLIEMGKRQQERQQERQQTQQLRETSSAEFNPRRTVFDGDGGGKRKRKRKQTRKTHKHKHSKIKHSKIKHSKHKHSKYKKSHKRKKTLKRKYKNKSKRR
jgi:hypothetical protein